MDPLDYCDNLSQYHATSLAISFAQGDPHGHEVGCTGLGNELALCKQWKKWARRRGVKIWMSCLVFTTWSQDSTKRRLSADRNSTAGFYYLLLGVDLLEITAKKSVTPPLKPCQAFKGKFAYRCWRKSHRRAKQLTAVLFIMQECCHSRILEKVRRDVLPTQIRFLQMYRPFPHVFSMFIYRHKRKFSGIFKNGRGCLKFWASSKWWGLISCTGKKKGSLIQGISWIIQTKNPVLIHAYKVNRTTEIFVSFLESNYEIVF